MSGFRHWLWHLLHPTEDCGDGMDGISEVSLYRQMLYDAFNDPEQIAQMMELPAISDEVAEMEQRAHVARLSFLAPVMPLLFDQSHFMGHAAAILQCSHAESDDLEQLQAVTAVFTNVIKASVVAAVSTAVGLGVLTVNKEVVFDE